MEFKDIESLIDKVNLSDISLFEMKIDGTYIKMDKSLTRTINESKDIVKETSNEILSNNSDKNIDTSILSSDKDIEKVIIEDKNNDEDSYIIKSPMVGTFYKAQGADLDPFVQVGDKVKSGDTLCIIEAMKLMNEIESDIDGEIIEILVDNAQMVEYGTELFRVRR